MTKSDYTMMFSEDVYDVACICHAALAQDSPETPLTYINQILNLMYGYLSIEQRTQVENYLAEKKYLPPLKLIDPTNHEPLCH